MRMRRTGRKLSFGAVSAAVIVSGTVAASIYIMANGLGLQDSLDFGAGAYYYADIPEFQKYLAWDAFQESLPYWVYVLLFLAWGFIVYRIWVRIDRKGK